jgi:predicted RNase H-like HicB family nuclease
MADELLFEVTQEEDGTYSARAVGESIFTQGDSWEELRTMALDAVKCHFDEGKAPKNIRLHLLREEILSAA